MFKEFKEFISRGNVVDLAVGIIIGAAFTTIVTSLVADIIMPVIGVITGGINFSNLFFSLSVEQYTTVEAAKAAGVAVIAYGKFINAVVNFLIVSFAIFMLVKQVNRFRKAEKDTPPAAPPREEVLLTEIRDLLKQK